MTNPHLDLWTAVLLGTPLNVVDQMSRLIDLTNPPDFLTYCHGEYETWKRDGSSVGWNLLLEGQLVLRAVSAPSTLKFTEAMQLTRMALETDTLFDTKLLRNLLAQRLWPEEVPPDEAMRVLEILEALGRQKRLAMTLLKFAKYPNARIQSKVAKVLGRCVDNVDSIEELFEHTDSRVRANLIEGLSRRKDLGPFEPLVERACTDQNARVSSLALALRARMGHTWSDTMIKMRKRSKIETVQKAAEMAAKSILVTGAQTAVTAAVGEVDEKAQAHPEEQA